jgi:hypothetical protein
MKVTILTLLFAFALVVASVVNYSLFVHKSIPSIVGQRTQLMPVSQRSDGAGMPIWLWVLPLLALPLLFVPFNSTEDEDDYDDFLDLPEVSYLRPYQPMAYGVKGGRTKKRIAKPIAVQQPEKK